MAKRLASLATEESAAVAVVFAIAITVFVGFLVLVGDVGYMYEMRRQMQSAADAAALAGMTEIINNRPPDTIAQNYAEMNDLIDASEALRPLETRLIDENADGRTDAYQVTVSKNANLAFAPIFGSASRLVSARARARRVYVTGVKRVIPWGVGTIRDPLIEARVGADPYAPLTGPDSDNTWQRFLDIPAAPAADGYLVDLKITNDRGYVDEITYQDVAAINVDVPGDSVVDVWLSENNIEPGESTWLNVEAAPGSPAPSMINNQLISGGNLQRIAGTDVYRGSITAPTEDRVDAFKAIPIGIKVQNETHNNAAVLVVRRAGSPVENIAMGSTHWWPAGGGTTSIDVKMQDFVFGTEYTLKLSAGQGVTGNFNALNYADVIHPDGVQEGGAGNQGGDYYRDNLGYGYIGILHLGDSIAIKEGVMPGPTTQGMTTHFSNCRCGCASFSNCAMTFDEWQADRPPNCKRLVLVPIVEFGVGADNQRAIVVALAVFFVEPGSDNENITGYFVEYATSSAHQDEPVEGPSMEAVRLDRPDS